MVDDFGVETQRLFRWAVCLLGLEVEYVSNVVVMDRELVDADKMVLGDQHEADA